MGQVGPGDDATDGGERDDGPKRSAKPTSCHGVSIPGAVVLIPT
ncbi:MULTISPECIES: hypothetical protein [unclassified Haloferax]|nr:MULTISPECIES: hypothetical protein [unclassified Haloferax]